MRLTSLKKNWRLFLLLLLLEAIIAITIIINITVFTIWSLNSFPSEWLDQRERPGLTFHNSRATKYIDQRFYTSFIIRQLEDYVASKKWNVRPGREQLTLVTFRVFFHLCGLKEKGERRKLWSPPLLEK